MLPVVCSTTGYKVGEWVGPTGSFDSDLLVGVYLLLIVVKSVVKLAAAGESGASAFGLQ